jgi:signal transduction histidine kinase
MRFFSLFFGFLKIKLNNQEKVELDEELKKTDRRRIEYFAFVSLLMSFIYLIVDFISFASKPHQRLYIILDFSLFLYSLFILANALSMQKVVPGINLCVKNKARHFFPLVVLFWATGIAVLEPNSLFNVVTYYIVVFLLSFAIFSRISTHFRYLFIVLVEYILLAWYIEQPIFSENFFLIAIGTLISIPFYFVFRYNRENSTAAYLKLNKMNKNLEDEVLRRTKELKDANDNLEFEVGQRKITEIKLRDALLDAEENNKLKSEFLANISHEIRTPLNAIVGFTEMITEEGVPIEAKKQFQELVASNTMYLLSTIDDIFDASMVNTKQIKPVNKAFNLNKFFESILYESNGLALKHGKKNLEFKVKYNTNNNLCILADEYYLKKAVMRLLDNSYKFTEEGFIEIGAVDKGSLFEIYIKDTGIGIKREDFSRILQPFVQGDGSFTRGYGGSGLGLTIVSGILGVLGLTLDFTSKVNEGSTFYVIFDKSLISGCE